MRIFYEGDFKHSFYEASSPNEPRPRIPERHEQTNLSVEIPDQSIFYSTRNTVKSEIFLERLMHTEGKLLCSILCYILTAITLELLVQTDRAHVTPSMLHLCRIHVCASFGRCVQKRIKNVKVFSYKHFLLFNQKTGN